MVERIPELAIPRGTRWPRDWQTYDGYQVVHTNHFRALEQELLIRRDTVRFYGISVRGELRQVNVRGRVVTRERAHLRVNKWLDVEERRGQKVVRTREYAYHANIRINGRWQDLFRYDNCHGGLGTLHRHSFLVDGTQADVVAVEPELLPPLSIIVREADAAAAFVRARLASQ